MKKIVVGIDGSAAAHEALEFACDEAKLWSADLVIVHAWHFPYASGDAFGAGMGSSASLIEQIESQAQSLLEEARVSAAARCGDEIKVSTVLAQGSAANALLENGKDADLIVVGSRGHGGFTSLLLGSTSHQVVHHAAGPVVVIRKPEA